METIPHQAVSHDPGLTADIIVTGDIDFLSDAAIRTWLADGGVRVATPAELLALLGAA